MGPRLTLIEHICIKGIWMSELKACPWCKSDDLELLLGDETYQILCRVCGACGPIRENEEGAKYFWNRRHGEGGW